MMGKRTRFQHKEIAQLVVQINRKNKSEKTETENIDEELRKDFLKVFI